MSETLLQPLPVPGGFYGHLCAYSKETPRKMHSCELNLTADEIKKVVKWALTTSCPSIRLPPPRASFLWPIPTHLPPPAPPVGTSVTFGYICTLFTRPCIGAEHAFPRVCEQNG